jgi:chemotaxis protein CheX
MITSPPITDQLIQQSIIKSVSNVCLTMLGLEASFTEKTAAATREDLGSHDHVLGCVGFVGDIDGLVYLCIPLEFARSATIHLLGMSAAEVERQGPDVVNDVIGEITNMTVGGFKNTLADAGFPCKLTVPTIIRGDNLSVAAIKSATRHVFLFKCAGHRLVADIQLKLG